MNVETINHRPGTYVELDNGRAECLLTGVDSAVSFPEPLGRFGVDCEISKTGRTVQLRKGSLWVKVSVKWVGSEDDSTGCAGWMMADSRSGA